MAGLASSCYLALTVGGDLEVWVLDPDSDQGWQFALNGGVAADVRTLVKPSWCTAIEATLPDTDEPVSKWLEVGVNSYPAAISTSVPMGMLPRLQAGLMQHQLQLTYITRIPMADHAR